MATKAAMAEWGVRGTCSYGSGIVTDVQVHVEFSTSPELNEVGAVVQQAQYDEHRTATVTVQCKHSVTLPKKTQNVSIRAGNDTVQGYVTGCDIIESNQAYVKIQLSCERYENCDKLTPYT